MRCLHLGSHLLLQLPSLSCFSLVHVPSVRFLFTYFKFILTLFLGLSHLQIPVFKYHENLLNLLTLFHKFSCIVLLLFILSIFSFWYIVFTYTVKDWLFNFLLKMTCCYSVPLWHREQYEIYIIRLSWERNCRLTLSRVNRYVSVLFGWMT